MKAFCEECREYKSCRVKERIVTKSIKGTSVRCKEKLAYCIECQSEVFVSDLIDENLESMERAYRECKGL